MAIAVLRIAGRANKKIKDEETLKRLKLTRKFNCVFVDEKDVIRKGMIQAVSHMVAYGKVSDAFVKELNSKRKAKDGVYSLHPPIGGFKRSSKVAAPKGILGRHEDISKLLERMLGGHPSKQSKIA